MSWSTIDDIRIELNKKEEEEARKNSYLNSLWLANVKKIYENYNLNLGYKRKNQAPPRKKRPAIILDKEKENYCVIFLTSSQWGAHPIFKLEHCRYSICPKFFDWNESSKIFILHERGQKVRKIFTIKEKDLKDIMTFCCICQSSYINRIKSKLVSKERNV